MLKPEQRLPNRSAADAKIAGEPPLSQPEVLTTVIDPLRHEGAFECVAGAIRQQ